MKQLTRGLTGCFRRSASTVGKRPLRNEAPVRAPPEKTGPWESEWSELLFRPDHQRSVSGGDLSL